MEPAGLVLALERRERGQDAEAAGPGEVVEGDAADDLAVLANSLSPSRKIRTILPRSRKKTSHDVGAHAEHAEVVESARRRAAAGDESEERKHRVARRLFDGDDDSDGGEV